MKSVITTFKSIKSKGCVLSSLLHKQVDVANENQLPLSRLLSRQLYRDDLGKEVGSINYVNASDFFFVKTKALQPYTFLPVFNKESTENITPQSFVNHDLKAGDIILSKDSNVGEVVILDKDYPCYMLSGALYKLPLTDYYRYYVLAFVKHHYFREQLNRMVPKGAIIRHAGTKFLDCLIPFPSKDRENIIDYVSFVTKKIVGIEIEMKKRHVEINDFIENEIRQSLFACREYKFSYATYGKLSAGKRLDTGIYSDAFQRITHMIENYWNGFFYIEKRKLKSGNTPKMRNISEYEDMGTRWITPTNCSDCGYIQSYEKISMPAKNNLNEDAALLINRTSRGGKGEYVGIGTFYDYRTYGKGHHNQGLYRVTGYDKETLVFITCFMNTKMMRKYCSALSVGSKMKEIKADQFLSIPIPRFNEEALGNVYRLFYTEDFDTGICSVLSMKTENVGLFNLNVAKEKLVRHLNSVLDMITGNIDFKVINNKVVF